MKTLKISKSVKQKYDMGNMNSPIPRMTTVLIEDDGADHKLT